ncbi:hypothetical protein MHU86_4405 [Fragilaria crotonensis]|nr:hypothetical protein MHU86_4405 [Fragilaria crotonensis]
MISDRSSSHIVPQSFQIIPLPPTVITCVLGELLRLPPKTQQLVPTEPAPSKVSAGRDTWGSSKQLGTDMTIPQRPDRGEQLALFSCFTAAAVREGWSIPGTTDRVMRACSGWQAGTVRAAIDSVAQALQVHKHGSPMHDTRGRLKPVWPLS